LEELELLSETFGVEIKAKEAVYLREINSATYISTGKLEEFVERVKNEKIDLVILDDEVTPAQQRNLETAFKCRVLDRTEIILGVFAERARTREARLQIELASKTYQLPRLTRLWTHLSRQRGTGGGGGGAYLKGEGEKQIEIDRRILKDEITKIRREIDDVTAIREVQRRDRKRSHIPTFAIVGYTNAGKSTLLNALTGADVFVEDKLFATLDTTTRRLTLGNQQEILLVDTVGFIRKLPHLLVAAFKSTLEESLEADILLHLVDASHPLAEEQANTTESVLEELGAGEKPRIFVFNKIDKCEDPKKLQKLKIEFPKHVMISALQREGFDDLFSFMEQELKSLREQGTFRIPQSDFKIASELMRIGTLLKKEYEENDVILHLELPRSASGRYDNYRVEE
jgi:GTP-binding protein HflX